MADMKDNPFFKIGALMGETNNKNIALQAAIEAQEAEIKRLRGMLEYAHEIFKAYADSSYSFNNCATVGEDAAGVIEAALKGE